MFKSYKMIEIAFFPVFLWLTVSQGVSPHNGSSATVATNGISIFLLLLLVFLFLYILSGFFIDYYLIFHFTVKTVSSHSVPIASPSSPGPVVANPAHSRSVESLYVKALYPYTATEPNELSFNEGDTIKVGMYFIYYYFIYLFTISNLAFSDRYRFVVLVR